MEHEQSRSGLLTEATGVNVSHCYQCGKCTAGCVLASEMDYPPSYVMRLLQTGTSENYRKVLSSEAIWLCLSCENCIARCPKEVDIPQVMDYLREESRLNGCIHPKARSVVAFHRSFLDSVKQTGRLYEVGLVAGFKMRTMRLTQDLKVAPVMFMKGKLNILPEVIKGRKRVGVIFSKTIENTKTNRK